jgi:hypothetical protein
MAARMFSGDQKNKLNQLFNEGIAVMQECEDLMGGLTDTIAAVAEELCFEEGVKDGPKI